MTSLLEKAVAQASKLPTEEQDAIASILLEELASEQRWAKAFAQSQDQLAAMAKEAIAEYRRGETEPIDED